MINKIISWWNLYWFSDRINMTSLKFYRFMVFGLSGGYIASSWNSFTLPTGDDYLNWQPISFFNLLEGPLSNDILLVLGCVWILSSACAAFSLLYFVTSWLTFFCALILLGHTYNFGYVYHSTHLYIMVVGLLCFTSFKKSALNWPIQMAKTYTVWIFFVCGLEKLYYGGGLNWALSDAFAVRLITASTEELYWNHWLLNQPSWVVQGFALFGLVVCELLSFLALVNHRLGLLFVLFWSLMHFFVILAFGSHTQFISQIFIYSLFLPPQLFTSVSLWVQGSGVNMFFQRKMGSFLTQ